MQISESGCIRALTRRVVLSRAGTNGHIGHNLSVRKLDTHGSHSITRRLRRFLKKRKKRIHSRVKTRSALRAREKARDVMRASVSLRISRDARKRERERKRYAAACNFV